MENNNGSMLIFHIFNNYDNSAKKFTLFTLKESSPELRPLAYEKRIIMNGPDDGIFSEISSKYSYGKIILDSPNNVIRIMQAMFLDISKKSEYVSKQFDIGLSIIDHDNIKLGKINNHEPHENSSYDWMSQIQWIKS